MPRRGRASLGVLAASIGCGLRVASRRRWCRRLCQRARPSGIDDFQIIRFRVPGISDWTPLPRVAAALALVALAANRYFSPPSEEFVSFREFSECIGVAAALACLCIPYVNERLAKAARRSISSAPIAWQADSLNTLALSESLSKSAKLDVAWASSVLLRLSNGDGMMIWKGSESGGEAICTRGYLRQLPGFAGGPMQVLAAIGRAWTPALAHLDAYCSTRAGLDRFPEGALPSRVLPAETESIVVKPIPGGGFLFVWSARPRSFTRFADRAWLAQVAAKLGETLHPGCAAASDFKADSETETCYELDILGQKSEESADIFMTQSDFVRVSPFFLSLPAIAAVTAQKFGKLAAILEMESGQNRADLVSALTWAVVFLQGIVWISEKPKIPELGDTSKWIDVEEVEQYRGLQDGSTLAQELVWTWSTLSSCTRASSAVIFWQIGDEFECIMRTGLFTTKAAGGKLPSVGDLCREVMKTGKGRFFPVLKNFPVKAQFLEWMPKETAGLLLTPLRPSRNAAARGILVMGIDTIRGLGKVDQAWIGAVTEKIAVSLEQGIETPNASYA